MAVVLLERTPSKKGILVLKHLELLSFLSLGPKAIENLRKHYIIGIYFGFYFELIKDIPHIDFYLAEDNVINFKSFTPLVPRCNLNGYNFVHRRTNERALASVSDFIFIGSYSPRKNLLFFLRALSLMSSSPQVVIVVDYNAKSSVQRRIRKSAAKLLANIENKQVSIIEVRKGEGLYLDRSIIDLLLQSSRVLVIPSRSEGAARVVAEAKILGLDVIANSYMKGGTNNHLHEVSDYLFKGLKDLVSALDGYMMCSKLNTGTLNHTVFDHDNSREILVDFIEANFGLYLEVDFRSSLLDLNMENLFQSHRSTLPRDIPDSVKNDECYSISSMSRLYDYLMGNPSSRVRRIKMYARKEYLKVKQSVEKAQKFFKSPLYYISLFRSPKY